LATYADLSLDGVKHIFLYCDRDEKLNTLDVMYKVMTVGQCLIFVNTKKMTPVIFQYMQQIGRNSAILSGDLTKEERDQVVHQFEKGEFKVLITTNLISRGYDEKKVNLVINYDVPLKIGERIVDPHT